MRKEFNRQSIKSCLQTKWVGRSFYFHEEIGSTNEEGRILAMQGAPCGTLIVADMQNAGKGRRGRSWQSPSSTNLYFSLIIRPGIPMEKTSMLTLVAAHAVCRALRQRTDLSCFIKWPNDVVVNGKKVCGILTELHLLPGQGYAVVVGIGINVKKQEFGELSAAATSLEEAMFLEAEYDNKSQSRRDGQECKVQQPVLDRSSLLAHILVCLEQDIEAFVEVQGLGSLAGSYTELLINKDRAVRVLDPKGEYEGIARGIDENGQLLVEGQDGRISAVYAGEVSVRGIYGYV